MNNPLNYLSHSLMQCFLSEQSTIRKSQMTAQPKTFLYPLIGHLNLVLN